MQAAVVREQVVIRPTVEREQRHRLGIHVIDQRIAIEIRRIAGPVPVRR